MALTAEVFVSNFESINLPVAKLQVLCKVLYEPRYENVKALPAFPSVTRLPRRWFRIWAVRIS